MAALGRLRRFSVLDAMRSPYFWVVVLHLLCFVWISPIELRGDAADYHQLALNLAQGHGFSRCPLGPYPLTAQRPPLFSILLAGLYYLGASSLWAPFALNAVFDLFSMRLAKRWAAEAGLGEAAVKAAPWAIGICPLLIGYSPYPTTENLSLLLFLGASVLLFRKSNSLTAAASGICWGLLALCRSYYLLFPAILFVFRQAFGWRRANPVILACFALIPPSFWVARNYAVFGKPAFSQGSTVGWQSYQGLCFTNFDWWDSKDVQRFSEEPSIARMFYTSCMSDEQLGLLDREVSHRVWQDCVVDRPFDTAFNIAAKAAMLLINWGQILPYTQIPAWIRWPINLALGFYWLCVARIIYWRARGRPKSRSPHSLPDFKRTPLHYGLLGAAYVLAVTIPFAVDSRYLIGPFLILLLVSIDLAGGVEPLMRSGLIWTSRPSKRGARTL